MTLNVLVICHRSIIACGLAALLEQAPDLHPILPALPALPDAWVQPTQPDVLLVDAQVVLSAEGWVALRDNRWDAPVVAVACCPQQPDAFLMALNQGVRAYVLEDGAGERLFQAIREAAAGKIFVSHPGTPPGSRHLPPSDTGDRALQPEEEALVRSLVEGLTNEEIATRLSCSKHTVKHRIDDLRGRLGLPSRARVAVWAASHGIVGTPSPGRLHPRPRPEEVVLG